MRISGITYAAPKTHRARTFFRILALMVVLAFLLSAGACFYAGWSMTHPEKIQDHSYLDSLSLPKYIDASFYDSKKGISLKGWYFPADNSDKTVILAHGYGSDRFQYKEKTMDMVNSFLEQGYNMLLFDFRHSGASGGKNSTVGYYEKNDLLGAVDYVKSQGAKHIILLGVSMGASTSLLAAAESKDVDAVIADTPFAKLKDLLDSELSKFSPLPSIFNTPTLWSMQLITGINPAKVDALKALKDITPRPVLFIHSVNDPTIPVSNSRELYKAYSELAGAKSELWETSGTEHADSYKVDQKAYMSKVFDFLSGVYPDFSKK